MQQYHLNLFCKYATINSNASYEIKFKREVPQVVSKSCDDMGIWRGQALGWKCKYCYKLFQTQCAIICRVIDRRSKLF